MKCVHDTRFPHLLSVHLGKKFSPIIVTTISAQDYYKCYSYFTEDGETRSAFEIRGLNDDLKNSVQNCMYNFVGNVYCLKKIDCF